MCFGCALDAVAETEEDVEEEEDEEDELHRVSTPVLVIFSFRRFASGALSTLFRKKPSLLPRLKAWYEKKTIHTHLKCTSLLFLKLFLHTDNTL